MHTQSLKRFARYSSLSVWGMIAVSCYILADTFFVSLGLGKDGLAALNLAVPAYNFIHGTGLMIGMGGATRYSICRSRGDEEGASRAFANSLYLTVFFSVLFVAAALLASRQLTALTGADEAVFAMTHTYLQVLLLFSPAFLLNDLLICFVRNDGDPRLSMIATIGGSLSNVVLDYLFIFPCGMGIFGAVFATGLAPVIGIAIMAPYWAGKRRGFHWIPGRPRLSLSGKLLSLGFPSLVGQVSTGIVMILLNAIILRLEGNTGVAAYGVVANLALVTTAVYTGIAQGIQPLASREYGLGQGREAQRYLKYAMVTMAVVSLVLYGVLFFVADPVAAIFNSEGDARLQAIAAHGIRLYFLSALFAGFNTVLTTYLPSVEQTLPAHVLSLLRGLVVILPVAFLFAALWGMDGVWLAVPATELLVAAAGAAVYGKTREKAAE